MKIKKFTLIFLILLVVSLSKTFLQAAISNSIIVKVGSEIITSTDLEHQVKLLVLINKLEMTQENVDRFKNNAIKSLIRNSIINIDIKKYNIESYNKNDLEKYISSFSDTLGTNKDGLKDLFLSRGLSYEIFVERYKNELLWNTLIFKIYKNQININPVEVENEVNLRLIKNEEQIEYELSEIVIDNSSQLLSQIKEGIKKNGFSATAKKFSISETASSGGKIGFVNENSLSKEYLDEIRNLKKGQITNPIKNVSSLVFIKIDDIKIKRGKVDIQEIKEKILERKKKQKLNLFSRSHFSNIENTILIKFL